MTHLLQRRHNNSQNLDYVTRELKSVSVLEKKHNSGEYFSSEATKEWARFATENDICGKSSSHLSLSVSVLGSKRRR